MRILFASGDPHLPQMTGGVQSSTDQLIRRLMALGHTCAVACQLRNNKSFIAASKLQRLFTRKPYSVDTYNEYKNFRSWEVKATIYDVCRDFKPDVVVIQHFDTVPLALEVQRAGIPFAIYFHNVEFSEMGGVLSQLPAETPYISNSKFTSGKYKAQFGIDSHIIPPVMAREAYEAEQGGENVTFINPHPLKGLATALAVADACPNIPFVFIESWALTGEEGKVWEQRIRDTQNVTLRPRTQDMKSIYAKAKIVLVPSQWEETWGRVASEAQISGTPVVGSNRGGLPEAIGPGGIVIEADAPVSAWIDAVNTLWEDEDLYEEKSAQAKAYALRPDVDPDTQTLKFLDILAKAKGNQVGVL